MINDCCQLEKRFNEFSLLRSLLRQLVGFDKSETTQHDREQYLLRLFDMNDLSFRRNLFLLNDLLDVRFRRNHIEIENIHQGNFVRTYETNINELLLHILNQLIESTTDIGSNSSRYSFEESLLFDLLSSFCQSNIL